MLGSRPIVRKLRAVELNVRQGNQSMLLPQYPKLTVNVHHMCTIHGLCLEAAQPGRGHEAMSWIVASYRSSFYAEQAVEFQPLRVTSRLLAETTTAWRACVCVFNDQWQPPSSILFWNASSHSLYDMWTATRYKRSLFKAGRMQVYALTQVRLTVLLWFTIILKLMAF